MLFHAPVLVWVIEYPIGAWSITIWFFWVSVCLEAGTASQCPFQASGSVSCILEDLIWCDLNYQRAFYLGFLLTLACTLDVFYILESNLWKIRY